VVSTVTTSHTGSSGVLRNVQTGSGYNPDPYAMETGVIFRVQSGRRMMLTTQLCTAPRVKMSGAIYLIPHTPP